MAIAAAIRHLRKGEWQQAHPMVQEDESTEGCWAHAIVHMLEGDSGNARYWYRRAHRAFPQDFDAVSEIDALAASIEDQKHATSTPAGERRT